MITRRALIAGGAIAAAGAAAALSWNQVPVERLRFARLDGSGTFDLRDVAVGSKPVLVSFFASWCAPCRAEHPLLLELSRSSVVDLVGISVFDVPANTSAFLNELGNPYTLVGVDPNRHASARLGVTGPPHTMILTAKGVSASRPGELTREALELLLDQRQ